MAREARFTRETALEYLQSRPETHGRKPLEELKTAELTRKARTAEKIEREGRQFSSKEARGHAGNVSGRAAPITHIDPRNPPKSKPRWKYAQDQFVVGRGPQEKIKADKEHGIKGKPGREAKPATTAEVLRALDKRDKEHKRRTGQSRDRVVIRVYGLFHNYNAVQGDRPETFPLATTHSTLKNIIAAYPDTTQVMNVAFGYPPIIDPEGSQEGWLEVWSVSVLTGDYEMNEEEEEPE